MTLRVRRIAVALCTLTWLETPAAAQRILFEGPGAAPQADEPTAAELFRQGREALANKNYAVACMKFKESVGMDPRVGPMISIAECEEGLGHLARARTYWQEAVDLAPSLGDARQVIAQERLDEIEARVPRLTLLLMP